MKFGENTEVCLQALRETDEAEWKAAEGSKIVEFYKKKNILVTGATGFLGKLLVEKLLRACPDLDTIYILVRPKKGEDEVSRINKLYSDLVFSRLAKMYPKFQHKIAIIKGDASLPNLGLSEDSITLIKERINIIYHIAATVRFDEHISVATMINVRSARDLIEIAKGCKKLDAYIHVSSAYANCNQKEIDEIIYKPKYSGDQLIKIIEETPKNVIDGMVDKLCEGWPNTYTFTKAIAEDVVTSHGKGLPLSIVRPAIIVNTYKEPLRSWIDNLYGAIGIAVGAGVGLLKSTHCKEELLAEIVPADYVINWMIGTSYKTAVDHSGKVYNYVSSCENRLLWKDFMRMCKYWGLNIPTLRSVWFYTLTLNRNYYVHLIYIIFLHFIPGLLMDLGMILSGNKPIMFKIYKKIIKFESIVAGFATQEWKFYNDNTQKLYNGLTEADQQTFPFSMKNIDWEEFHKTCLLGARQYVIKDDFSTLPQAMIRWKRLYYLNEAVKYIFYLGLVWVFYMLFSKLFF